jgi:hypothetical protein
LSGATHDQSYRHCSYHESLIIIIIIIIITIIIIIVIIIIIITIIIIIIIIINIIIMTQSLRVWTEYRGPTRVPGIGLPLRGHHHRVPGPVWHHRRCVGRPILAVIVVLVTMKGYGALSSPASVVRVAGLLLLLLLLLLVVVVASSSCPSRRRDDGHHRRRL